MRTVPSATPPPPEAAGAANALRILGIDPGLRLTGYACVRIGPGGGAAGEPSLSEAGVFRFNDRRSVAERLVELERDLGDVLGRFDPTHVCIEKLFAHYKRPVTAAIMGHARGVVLLAAGVTYETIPPSPWATTVKNVLVGLFDAKPFGSTGDRVREHYLAYHASHAQIGCRALADCPPDAP